MGWLSESKECIQKRYGGYCNNARQQGKEPLTYIKWQENGCPKKYKLENPISQYKLDNCYSPNGKTYPLCIGTENNPLCKECNVYESL